MEPLQICIGPTIRIARESWCLPYMRYFNKNQKVNDVPYCALWLLEAPKITNSFHNLLVFRGELIFYFYYFTFFFTYFKYFKVFDIFSV